MAVAKATKQNSENTGTASAKAEAASTEPQHHPFASVLDPWLKQSEMHWTSARNANAVNQASAAATKGFMDLIQETSQFFSTRLKKDMDTLSAFAGCRTPEDYFKVQADYFDAAVRDYGDQAAKLAHMTADVTQGSCKPIEDRVKETLHSVASIPEDNGAFA